MTETNLAVVSRSDDVAAATMRLSSSQIAILKDTVAKGTSDEELGFFLEVCRNTGLNPFKRQIHCVVRGEGQRRSMTIQTGIDGYRAIAESTKEYRGQVGPFWCGEDGQWRDVWLARTPPAAAKVGVLRVDFDEPIWGVARFDAYVQMRGIWEDGPNGRKVKVGEEPNEFWSRMPDVMLAKCAEALAIRKAFPQQLAGVYSDEEMGQANNDREYARSRPAAVAERLAEAATSSSPGNGTKVQPEPWMRYLGEWLGPERKHLPRLVLGAWTVAGLRSWRESLPPGTDPYAEAVRLINAYLAAEAGAAAAATAEEANGDPGPASAVEGEVVDEGAPASAPGQFSDDEPFE